MKALVLVVVAGLFLRGAAAADKDAVQKEMATFNGTWQAVSVDTHRTQGEYHFTVAP